MDDKTRLEFVKLNVIRPKKNGQVRNIYNQDFNWLIEQAEKVEQLKNRLIHFMKEAETKQKINYKLQRKAEQDKENIKTALYELDILHKKVNPSEYSSIDSHFKRIKDILRNE